VGRSPAPTCGRQFAEIENDFQKWYAIEVTSLADTPLGRAVTVHAVEGPRAFRRRLLEMGLVPGTAVRVVTVAPLGDPLRIEVRGGQWSIRRAEAAQIQVEPR
jgi:ferrous iron transport protein A